VKESALADSNFVGMLLGHSDLVRLWLLVPNVSSLLYFLIEHDEGSLLI
jgi:hypothetical protein